MIQAHAPGDGQTSGRRVAFVLPGLHRVNRGAEVAFESIARCLARRGGWQVTLIGSGRARGAEPYTFHHAGCIDRQWFRRWPEMPWLRDMHAVEELTFLPALARQYTPEAYDVTVTCSFPFVNGWLRARKRGGRRPAHVFVTQNGDWPAYANTREFRHFGCEGIVCTNPQYYQRVCDKWPATLIPNGVDPERFHPGRAERARFDLPEDAPVALMVSALTSSKRVLEGIEAAALVPGLHLVVAGDGPLRRQVQATGRQQMGQRFHAKRLPRELMPALYRSADVFLHMSMDEPSANAYIEALATGLPIVTHDRAVTRWTLEDCALLVDTTDQTAVAEALQRALDHQAPHAVAARRDLVQRRFAWDAIAGQYARFFEAVCRDEVAPVDEPGMEPTL